MPERLLATVFDRVGTGLCLVGPDNRVMKANSEWLRSTGLTAERALGKDILDLYPENRDLAAALHSRARAGEAVEIPRHVQQLGGREASWEGTVSPVPMAGEVGLLITALEVSARVRAEGERERLLAETQLRTLELGAIFENTNAQLALLDRDMNFRMVNSAYAEASRHSRKELLGQNHFTLFPNEENEAIFRRVRDTGEPYRAVEKPFEFADQPERGTTYWNWILVPLKDGDDGTQGLLLSLVDVTPQVLARQRVEELARIAERRADELETILESMADAVFVCDGRGIITMANGAALDLTGESLGEDGRTIADHLRSLRLRFPDGRPISIENLAISRALRGEVITGREEIGTRSAEGEEIDLLISAAPIKGKDGTILGAVEVVRDVSELRELDRLTDQFISVAAHELKTPVTVMKGFAQVLLRRDERISPEQRKVLEGIDRGANRIDHVVQDLLDVSVLSTGRLRLSMERIDLADFVGQTVVRLALNASRHRLRVVRADPIVVHADPEKLTQVLEHLLDNAVRYSPLGGSIEVQVRAEEKQAVVSVADQGIGIPAKKQSRIFQRFYRAHTGTSHDYGGLGVDLYISREIVRCHGGEMTFESEEGVGSIFHCTLPLGGANAGW